MMLSSIVILFAAIPLLQAQAFPAGNQDSLGRSNPRGTVIGFLTAAHKGDWNSATKYLENVSGDDAVELSTQLSVVLDQGLPADLDRLSDQPEGNLKDNLPANKELAGIIETKGGPLPVMLDHVRRGNDSIWLFSPDTLKEIPAVYDEFSSTWLSTYVPKPLLRRGWLGMPLWQWLMLAIGVAIALLVAAAMRLIALPVLRRVFRALTGEQEDWLLDRLMAPLRGLVSLLVLEAAISSLHLPLFARQFWFFAGGGVFIILSGWFFVRSVFVLGRLVDLRLQRRGEADATAVIRLCERILSVLTFCFVVFLLLKQVGLVKDATTLVAGVSVGGIAIAFAAQKTLENLFGGVSIIFDRTIRVGDYCKIGAQSGTVEDIGLRSTSLKTDERTVLTIPNGQLSTMNIENFARKDKMFFHHTIGIRRETTASQMRALLDALRKLLADDARIETSTIGVRLVKFAPSSLDIEVAAYVLGTDGTKFLQTQEDLLLRIMDTVEANGTAAAFPSQTLYMGRDKSPMPPAESKG
jgi:MscS family membrane protein